MATEFSERPGTFQSDDLPDSPHSSPSRASIPSAITASSHRTAPCVHKSPRHAAAGNRRMRLLSEPPPSATPP